MIQSIPPFPPSFAARRVGRSIARRGWLLAALLLVGGCGPTTAEDPDVRHPPADASSGERVAAADVQAEPKTPPSTPPAAAHEHTAQAADDSLALVPADAAFYMSTRRGREQFDAVANSRTLARLLSLPVAQMLIQKVEAEAKQDPEHPLTMLRSAWNDPPTRLYIDYGIDAVSNEVFMYGDLGWAKLFGTYLEQVGAMSGESFQRGLRGESNQDLPPEVAASILDAVSQLDVPVLVIGTRLANRDRGLEVMQKAHFTIALLLSQVPQLTGRFEQKEIGGANHMVLRLGGDMIPFEDEELPPGTEDAIARVRKKSLYVTLGQRGSVVLLTMGPSLAHLEKLGAGPKLVDLEEFTPYRARWSERITSVSYTSAALRQAVATRPEDIDGLAELAQQGLGQAELPEKIAARARADVADLAALLKSGIVQPEAKLAFSFLVPEGTEAYSYDWTPSAALDSSQELTILEHLGGAPVAAFASRANTKRSVKQYETAVEWVKRFGFYIDLALNEESFGEGKPNPIGAEDRAQAKEVYEAFLPLLERLDAANRNLLIPATADGQSAFVLDAKWKSRAWHASVELPLELPLPELAMVIGLSDSSKFREALVEYAAVLRETIETIKRFAPPGQVEFAFPEIGKTAQGDVELFSLDMLAQLGVDPQVKPTLGLSDKYAVLTFSHEHALRLLKASPLAAESAGQLTGEGQKRASASLFRWPSLVEAVRPWVAFIMAQVDAPPPVQSTAQEVLTILTALRSRESSTSVVDGATVTHSRTTFHDLTDADVTPPMPAVPRIRPEKRPAVTRPALEFPADGPSDPAREKTVVPEK